MRTKDFLDKWKCEKSLRFSYLESEDRRHLELGGFFMQFFNLYKDRKGELDKGFLQKTGQQAEVLLSETMASYSDWLTGEKLALRKRNDMLLFQRFYQSFLMPLFEGAEIKDVNVVASAVLSPNEDEAVSLSSECHAVLRKNGIFYALIVNTGKNGEVCNKGRKASTKVRNQLDYIVLKCGLEKKYPGIVIVPVYFSEGESKGDVFSWCDDGTKGSNVFWLDFEECIEQGEFSDELCMSGAFGVLAEYRELSAYQKCENCYYKSACQMQTYSQRKVARDKKCEVWTVPEYDSEQQKLVEFKEGKLLCCAGPGSGKTASLIGRVLSYGKSVPTEQMLLVSFTEKAAGELRERLNGLLPDDEQPRIGTLNSIGAEIIRMHERLHKVKEPRRLLTEAGERRIVKEILDSYTYTLKGVDYKKFTGGSFNTVNTVWKKLKLFEKDSKRFLADNPEYEVSEWEKLLKDFQDEVKCGEYTTYDEQITLASKMLSEDAVLSEYYHQVYKYVMVDEYQDINERQDELIKLLVGDGGNLVCIGDDDQSIYGFNGCSSEFMQKFTTRYPDASMVLLSKNYRSTKRVVELCNDVLEGMDIGASGRIGKFSESIKFAKEGEVPVLYNDNSVATVNACIRKALDAGYTYSDIAVIGTTWGPLKKLKGELAFPAELGKAPLVDDYLFHLVYHTLEIALGINTNFNPYVYLGVLYERDIEWFSKTCGEVSAGKELSDKELCNILSYARKLVSEKPVHYVARLSAAVDMDESDSEWELLNLVRSSGVATVEELYYMLHDMVEFGENKNIEYAIDSSITLITGHSSKGKEWPVVIVYDADQYSGEVDTTGECSMDRRLLYVTLSRPRDLLYILKNNGKPSVLDKSEYLRMVR